MASSTQVDYDSQQIHRKRRGAITSCAECRRLKLKCERTFPCSNCVRKGCSQICPEGSLTTGKGNRFVLANTTELHEKIGQLSNRVRELEDGLQRSHALTSSSSHPLLSEELLQIKRPLEREPLKNSSEQEDKGETADSITAIGSLAISDQGSSFFGHAANAWYLLQNEKDPDDDDDLANLEPIPATVPWLATNFPFSPRLDSVTETELRGLLFNQLPDMSTASSLTELYYRHAAWMYTPITQAEFQDKIFRNIYSSGSPLDDASLPNHGLAIMFLVLAFGVLLDLERPPRSRESLYYYNLGRACLSLESILERHSMSGIQALLLMCHYMFFNDIEGSRWAVMGLVTKIAQSLGLHRDSGKWNVDEAETHRRRCLMYEVLTYDSWQSLTFGRPPSFSMVHIDSKQPHGSTPGPGGIVEMSFAAWKHKFVAECLSVVHDRVFGAQSLSYKTVQALGLQVADYPVPPSLKIPGFERGAPSATYEQASIELTMQRHIVFAIREISLFYIHRGFFARAIEDRPIDPLGSKFGASFLAAYRTARAFVTMVHNLYRQHPDLTQRMWFLFTHVLSCAIVLGSIAEKTNLQVAPYAWDSFESACNLFGQISDHKRTAKIMPILQKIRDRVIAASNNGQSPAHELNSRYPAFGGSPVKDEEDQITALGGGKARLVPRKKSTTPSTPSNTAQSPHSQSSMSPPTVHEEPVYAQASPSQVSPQWQGYSQMPTYGDYASPGESVTSPQQITSSPLSYHQPTLADYNAIPVQQQALDPYFYYQQPQASNTMPMNNGHHYQNYSLDMNFVMPASEVQGSWQNFMEQYR